MKKILVLNGSPKKAASTTMAVTNSFLKGLVSSGKYESETIHVSDLNIKPCLGCLGCWGRSEGECVIKGDDAASIKAKILESDIVIMSFPIFIFGIPGSMKVLIDRLLSLLQPYHGQPIPENGSFHGFNYDMSGKTLFLFAGAAWSDERIFEPIKAQFDCIVGKGKYIPIFCPQMKTGVGLGTEKPRYIKFINKYEVAGAEFAETGAISEATMKILDQRMYPAASYRMIVDDFWQREKAAGSTEK